MIPVWLLDVDGVLNAHDAGWIEPHREGHVEADGIKYPFRWAPELITRIGDLHKCGLVEVRWCTTWCGHTPKVEALLGLPQFAEAFDTPTGKYTGDIKAASALSVVRHGRTLIWTDDMEVPTRGKLYHDLTVYRRNLLIRPDPSTGLSPEHMTAIERTCRP
jgi:hypothetical protein